jgi:hypothetical protein
MKSTKKKEKKDRLVKDKMEKFYYICIGFSLVIQQQLKHILSHMMESQFPTLDALLRYASHLLQKANVNL